MEQLVQTQPREIIIKSAFKEWKSVIEALGQGEQIIILRRGGIIEDEGDFVPKEKYFLLFPTMTHERKEYLKKTYDVPETGDEIEIKYWAETVFAKKIENEETLLKLSPYHIWKDEVVLERFHRWNKDEVWCLVVRVFKFPKPLRIKMKPEFGGCKSWIDIREKVDISNSVPVIPDDKFNKIYNEIMDILSA